MQLQVGLIMCNYFDNWFSYIMKLKNEVTIYIVYLNQSI